MARQVLSIRKPDDMHIHLRDGDSLRTLVPHVCKQFKRAIVMPNLKPPVVNTDQALEYRARILEHVPAGYQFQPLMTLYLTDLTTPEEIVKAYSTGQVSSVKYYPAGATTNSDSGVTDIFKVERTLMKMAELGMPLMIHGEVTDQTVDIFDREAEFIRLVLRPLIQRIPSLKVVMEHITTKDAVEFVLSAPENVAATITCHHLLYNRNAIFAGGINPHKYCLPVLKREEHRQALVKAATSGNPKFFLGTDSAPHTQHTKETDKGCAGIYTAHAAIELYAEAFDLAGSLDKLQGFASEHGAKFYRLPINTETITLEKTSWTVPEYFNYAGHKLVPLRAGEEIPWKLTS